MDNVLLLKPTQTHELAQSGIFLCKTDFALTNTAEEYRFSSQILSTCVGTNL